jgi:Rrf2 family protein
MLALAARHKKGSVTAADIAREQGLSLKYLEAILASLKAAGLVRVKRGVGGGYQLARPPERITLLDVLMPLEDSLGFVHCTMNDTECDRAEECMTRRVWQELKEAVEEILRSKTLASLLADTPCGRG